MAEEQGDEFDQDTWCEIHKKKSKVFFNEIMHAMLVKYAYHIVRVHYFGDGA